MVRRMHRQRSAELAVPYEEKSRELVQVAKKTSYESAV